MDIAIYIAEFLRQNDEVSLPGIGTFFKQRINGYFDSKKNTFIPPRQFLAFRVSDKENIFLAEYLVKIKNISEASANYFISKYAEKVKDFLSTSGKMEMTELGILKKTLTGFQFEPSKDFKFANDFFGLKEVSEIIELKLPAHSPLNVEEKPALPKEVVKNDPIEEPVVEEYSRTNNSKYYIPLSILVLVGLGVLLYTYYPQFSSSFKLPPIKKQVDTLPETKSDELSDTAKFDTVNVVKSPVIDTSKATDSIPKADSIKNNTLAVDTVSDKKITFEIIASSLNRQSDAEQLVKNYKKMGLDGKIVYANEKRKNKILISIGSFSDRESAQKELTNVKKNVEKGAYIYIKKPQ
ncbi:MAG: Sporulation domain protein [Sphingobacteriales bacterium]|nr:Sporulation domain protein [Sphingobacteriales bacterium]